MNTQFRSGRRSLVKVAGILSVVAGFALTLGGCQVGKNKPAVVRETDSVIKRIEAAHHADQWRRHGAVEATATVDFGGNRIFDGVMTFSTDGGRARLTRTDGAAVVFDGTTAWVSGDKAAGVDAFPSARFQVLTWPYFLAVPYKLADGGTSLTPQGSLPAVQGETSRPTWKLTFAPGIGDAPQDWYLLMPDPASGRLTAMAYIVTFGKTLAEAEKEPHAIVYADYRNIDGVPVPHRWTFHDYSRADGINPKLIGEVILRDIKFLKPQPTTFTKPAGATEAAMPTK